MTLSSIGNWLSTNLYVKAVVLMIAITVGIVSMLGLAALALYAFGWLFSDGTWLLVWAVLTLFVVFFYLGCYVAVSAAKRQGKPVWRYLWDEYLNHTKPYPINLDDDEQ